MSLEFISKAFNWGFRNDKMFLEIECPKEKKEAVQQFVTSLTDKEYDVTVKQHREIRGIDANSYCWVICDKIAKAMHDGKTVKEDIYREAIRQVGEFEDKPIKTEDVEKHIKMWDLVGEGWFSEELRPSKLKDHTVVRDYYGSHVYDTASMSILIDYIVEQAKEMGIETKTPQQIAELKRLWEERQ